MGGHDRLLSSALQPRSALPSYRSPVHKRAIQAAAVPLGRGTCGSALQETGGVRRSAHRKPMGAPAASEGLGVCWR